MKSIFQQTLLLHVLLLLFSYSLYFFFVFFYISCLLPPSSLSHQCTSSFYSVFLQHIFFSCIFIPYLLPYLPYTLHNSPMSSIPFFPCYHISPISLHITMPSAPCLLSCLCIPPCLQLHASSPFLLPYHHIFSSIPHHISNLVAVYHLAIVW